MGLQLPAGPAPVPGHPLLPEPSLATSHKHLLISQATRCSGNGPVFSPPL